MCCCAVWVGVLGSQAMIINENAVLKNAAIKVARKFGLTDAELCDVLGMSDLHLDRLTPDTASGRRAGLLIRAYAALYQQVGNDQLAIDHWLSTSNHHFGASPRSLLTDPAALHRMVRYLEAL